jgi:hypothetical protein
MTQTPAEDAPDGEGTVSAPTLRSILEPLLDIPRDERKFCCRYDAIGFLVCFVS